jgi:hypothetical protein
MKVLSNRHEGLFNCRYRDDYDRMFDGESFDANDY